jgi:hypothetical protein
LTVAGEPLATLNTDAGATSASTAASVAAAASDTYVKSRTWSPPPYTVTGRPAATALMNRWRAMSGRCPGP